MKRFSLFILLLALAFTVFAGCNTTTDTASKPLEGIIIQKINISGDRPDVVVTAITAELLSQGAKMATKPGTPGAVVLNGTSSIEMATDVAGEPYPKLLTVNVKSNTGSLAATAEFA